MTLGPLMMDIAGAALSAEDFSLLQHPFVGGVVLSGESYAAAARREIDEELGIRGPEPESLFSHLYQGEKNRSWIQVYRVVWEGPIVHQEEEIAWGRWLPEGEMRAWAQQHEIVPDGKEIFDHYWHWRHERTPPSADKKRDPREIPPSQQQDL